MLKPQSPNAYPASPIRSRPAVASGARQGPTSDRAVGEAVGYPAQFRLLQRYDRRGMEVVRSPQDPTTALRMSWLQSTKERRPAEAGARRC
jgi:hypothetical protein